MMARSKQVKTAKLTSRREAALTAVPYPLPVVRKKEEGKKLYVTVMFERPKFQQFLGAEANCERTFGLDAYGRQVYETCDGKRSVKEIINKFAYKTKVRRPEAETADTKFFRVLMTKGLIAMQMEKPDP